MINIGLESYKKTTSIPLLQTGFRPFFLLASLYAVVVMVLWSGMYAFGWQMPLYHVNGMTWHGHEMVFGYTQAVIAGFLLTAVRNWTRQQTADGVLLAVLAIFWIVGRIPPINSVLAYFQAFGDLMFGALLFLILAMPILLKKQTRQWPVLLILFLSFVFNMMYYLGEFHLLNFSLRDSVYLGFYLELSLIFIFARRMIPNFINSALRLKVPLKTRKGIDSVLVPLFLLFAFNEFWFHSKEAEFVLSAILLILNGIRLVDWYQSGMWKRHLIWSLYVAYVFLTLGFFFKLLEYGAMVGGIGSVLSLHVFTIGGIGLITISMMARVSYGHTGRNVLDKLDGMKWMFVGIAVTVIFRSVLPMFFPALVVHLVGTAMLVWIITFLLFVFRFWNILLRKRLDGAYG